MFEMHILATICAVFFIRITVGCCCLVDGIFFNSVIFFSLPRLNLLNITPTSAGSRKVSINKW